MPGEVSDLLTLVHPYLSWFRRAGPKPRDSPNEQCFGDGNEVIAQGQAEMAPVCGASWSLGQHFLVKVWALPAQDLLRLIVVIETLCRM